MALDSGIDSRDDWKVDWDTSADSEEFSDSDDEARVHLLKAVTDALKEHPQDCSSESENSSESDNAVVKDLFCVEDTFLSKDLNVTVKGIGKLNFPFTENVINGLIKISSKAKFGKGEETLLDVNVRDTQMISAKDLTVDINQQCLTNALQRLRSGLNVEKSSVLVPQLNNMLICGPGQFCKMHRDSEKMKNMVATLVILLPSVHTGGDLIINHENKKHVFFGSQNPDLVKCIMFYSDCQHEIEMVRKGYRVALTYNVALESSIINTRISVNNYLDTAVLQYFSNSDSPERLIYYLNHSYSEHSLKWNLLKGEDRTRAYSLLAVAKKQGKIPCLALFDYSETFNGEDGYFDLIESKTKLIYWVDDNNKNFKEEESYVSNDEICYTIKTKHLFKPYKIDESGPTGNEGETVDHWYRRACVILYSNKCLLLNGYKEEICDLHKLTTQPGNEKTLIVGIEKYKDHFYQEKFWKEEVVIDYLLDISIYISDTETAVSILIKLGDKLLEEKQLYRFIKLETKYDKEAWINIISSWKTKENWNTILKKAIEFAKVYKSVVKLCKSFVMEILLKEAVDDFIKIKLKLRYDISYRYLYSHKQHGRANEKLIEKFCVLLKICADFGVSSLEKKLTDHLLSNPSLYPALSVVDIFFKIQNLFDTEHFHAYNDFKESTLALVHETISQLQDGPDDLTLSLNLPCTCEFCIPIDKFFQSNAATRLVVPASEGDRLHVIRYLNHFKDEPVSFYIEKTGRPYKIVVEKVLSLLSKRNNVLVSDLKKAENKLKNLSLPVVKTWQTNNEDKGNKSDKLTEVLQVVGPSSEIKTRSNLKTVPSKSSRKRKR